jgi:Polyketide cyclase / dehydrase and lipid transport
VKTIHHVLDIDAPPATVWRALTDPATLSGWWSTRLDVEGAGVGSLLSWSFAGDFNPVMEVSVLHEAAGGKGGELGWVCVAGHDPWQDGTFRFQAGPLPDGRTRLRFWQECARELTDDAYGIYNFNWGYYLESLRLLCVTGEGKPFQPEPTES